MDESVSFWESSFIWRDAIIVAMISAGALSYLGVWVALKRVVYVPLALSQVSSVGVVFAFLICGFWDLHDFTDVAPSWLSLLFAVGAAFYFASQRGGGDTATVVAYLVSAAAALLMAGFIRQDLHDVQSILFGSAVLVETIQIAYVGVAAFLVLMLHLLFYRRFLFVSFDSDSAGAAGIAVYRHEVFLYISFAIMISVSTRAIGALPAFGFTVLPALAGLRLGSTMFRSFAIAIGIGIACAAFGYYFSFIWELPTGAAMVGLAGIIYIVSLAYPVRTQGT